MVKDPLDTDAQQPEERRDSANGRPEARQVTTVRRLVQACEQARSPAEREHVVEEAAGYLRGAGDEVSTVALITLLELPAGGRGRRVLKLAEERLAQCAPAKWSRCSG